MVGAPVKGVRGKDTVDIELCFTVVDGSLPSNRLPPL